MVFVKLQKNGYNSEQNKRCGLLSITQIDLLWQVDEGIQPSLLNSSFMDLPLHGKINTSSKNVIWVFSGSLKNRKLVLL